MSTEPKQDILPKPTPKGRRLRYWFAIGFLIVFLALGFKGTFFYNGAFLRETILWHYYLLEIQQAMNSSPVLGPTSGNASTAIITFLAHLGFSFVAGVIGMGLGWVMPRR